MASYRTEETAAVVGSRLRRSGGFVPITGLEISSVALEHGGRLRGRGRHAEGQRCEFRIQFRVAISKEADAQIGDDPL